MNTCNNPCASWINSVLASADKTPFPEIICLIEQCGMECARENGHLEAMDKLRGMTSSLQSKADYLDFFRNSLHINAEEAEDGIILRLNKPRCTCPMAPQVAGPALCHCTQGHEKLCWSRAFGKPVDVEIVESWLRGGHDCLIKLKGLF